MMSLEILYEDAYCLAINKPNNLLVHHSHYARNIEEESLLELVRQMGFFTAAPVHRLDRKTSGVVLFAKQKEHVAQFQALFTTQQIEKHYLALVRGFTNEEGEVTSPVKNERGNYKEAHTKYKQLMTFERDFKIPPYESQRYSLVHFQPMTGRMHQLRIHANKMAHPIINDPKYGNRHHNHYFQEILAIDQLFLHAFQLVFVHPILKKNLLIKADLPLFWSEYDPKINQFLIRNQII